VALRGYFVRRQRINGPRKSRVKVGLRPIILFLAVLAVTTAIGLRFVVDPDLEQRVASRIDMHTAQLHDQKSMPNQSLDATRDH